MVMNFVCTVARAPTHKSGEYVKKESPGTSKRQVSSSHSILLYIACAQQVKEWLGTKVLHGLKRGKMFPQTFAEGACFPNVLLLCHIGSIVSGRKVCF